MLIRCDFATFTLVSLIGAGRSRAAAAGSSFNALDDAITKIGAESGGRRGVAVLDTSSGRAAIHAGDRSAFRPHATEPDARSFLIAASS